MAGPRGEYKKSAMRREQILDAAFTIFSKGGYTASSVNEIARAVGMTQTGVLHHFAGGKVALLRAILEQRDARAQTILAEQHGRDFLAGLVEISRTQETQRGAVQLYTILAAEATDPDHPAHDYFIERFTRITGAVAAAIAEVGDANGLVDGVDPKRTATELIAMVEGLELLWLNGLDVDMAEDMRRRINSILTTPI
ncbi:TetR/AcrR family transcriptional regulator [Pseudoclavibacter sp. VKM Ac-2867]|uniref:TetR/AcrR family transcriptional regulator n=1 Tax=Pseudoclavibacter sp. VKM Ac-2867 TaxID=2783829 RepID=UPI00188DC1B8|nr:TetR/AcrR family transcriptional regulator [Pseudoclavibacter sp. VKM Ac-2867]MBF4459875.1 TetR/AcrR family transcriptional regulator [Pseudoclavibacter sp. VKM Ac-2867]